MSINRIRFEDMESPLSENDLVKVETELNFHFPPSFKIHYLRCNGGSPEKCIFVHGDDEFVVQEFFPIRYGSVGDRLEDVCRDLRNERNLIPQYLIPFADDPGGDFFCFSTRVDELGAVYFVCCDDSEKSDEAIQLLAPSLDVFLLSLQSDDDHDG